MRNSLLCLSLFLLFSFTACEEQCEEVECANDPFLFTIYGDNGMDLLNDPSSTLDPERVEFFYREGNSSVFLDVLPQQNEAGRTIAFQTFLANEEVSQYFFRTNISTADTLEFTFENDPNGCCPSMNIGSVLQNGKPLERNNSGYSLSIPTSSGE